MTASLDMIRGRSNIVPLTNNSGGALVAGDVVVQDTTADEKITTTTSAASTLKVFVAAESIASGAAGRFYESGYCPLVNVNASVTRGRFLFTHTVAKQAAENATYGSGAFGKILKSGTTPSAIIYSATAQVSSSGHVIQDEGTPLTSRANLNFVGSGVAATDDAGNNATVVTISSGGGTALKRLWSPDAPPASATSQDDEFDNASLDAKWTEFDPNNVLTVSESSTYDALLFTQSTRAGTNITGIYETIPAGDFTIYARISIMAQRRDATLGGIALWENPADTSKSILTSGITFVGGNTTWEVNKWTNHNTFSSNVISIVENISPHNYFRLRRSGTDYFAAISLDGIAWFEYSTAIAPLATPTKMGVFLDNENTGANVAAIISFFRYVASDTGITGVMGGRLIDIGTF